MTPLDLAPLVATFGLPALGGFLGSLISLYVTCPNRGCCQQRRLKEVLEHGR